MPSQTWNPKDYGQNARFVTDLGSGVVDLLAPRPGERILDLGCGDGVLTKKLSDLGCQVVGVDSSPEFLKAAQALGVEARLMDGQELTFDNEFDAVLSNAALHWMKQAEKVIDGVWRALKPGGRFVAEMGGKGNIAQIENASRQALQKRGLLEKVTDPNYYPSPEAYRALLEKRGFRAAYLNHFSRPTPLPKSYLEALPPGEVETFLQEVQEALRPTLCDAQGRWIADYVRLRFAAFKP
jgi:trans-aconitate methyltransferase